MASYADGDRADRSIDRREGDAGGGACRRCENGRLSTPRGGERRRPSVCSGLGRGLERLRSAFTLERHPNVLPHQRFFKASNKAGRAAPEQVTAFMVRQYFSSNLYDRLSTRPFLTLIEKRWMAFQLLKALQQVHGRGECHGVGSYFYADGDRYEYQWDDDKKHGQGIYEWSSG